MRKKKIAWIMLCLVLLNGCGAKQDIPELIEPVVDNESFRPVEYGSVAKTEIEIADVVPEEYCHFMQKASEILEICVDLGQYVEKGDVIAKMDVSEFQRELDAKREELALCNTNYSYQEKIYKEQVKIQKYKREDFTNQKDKKAAKECDTEIKVLEENQRYDKLLYEHQVTMLEEEIAELNELTKDGTILAEYSGYVTYIKNLEESNKVGAYENIVIISDYNLLHLELTQDISSQFYTQYIGEVYNQIYTFINGKQCDVEVYSHSNEELIAIQSAGIYPKIRLDVENLEKSAKPGDKLPIYFTNSNKENVLRIGSDSLYSESNNHFVYVKNGEDKEKREIQIGYQSESYVEVLDGLEEGEWVYYSSNAIMPDQYEEYTVDKQEFTPTNGEIGLKGAMAYTKMYSYTFQQDALVESVYFANGDQVKKGDLICVLNTGVGSANLKEIKQNMSNRTSDYETGLDSFHKQIKDMDKQIKAAKKKASNANKESAKEETAKEETVKEANVKETTEVQQLQCQKKILQYEKKKFIAQYEYDYQMMQRNYDQMLETNNGQGKLEIYAEQDGLLGNVNVYEEKQMEVAESNILFQIYDESSRKLFINTKTDYIGVGNEATVQIGEKQSDVVTATVVGNSATNKAYVAVKNDKIYITKSSSTGDSNKAYLSVEETDWEEGVVGAQVSYSLVRLRDVVVVPIAMLYEEVNQWNPEVTYYYVWKIVDGILVKQYVQVEESFNTSNQVCILDGLEAGDVLAKPIVNEE